MRLWDALERGPFNFTQIHTLFHRNLRTDKLESLCKELTRSIEVMKGKTNETEMVVRGP